MRQASSPVRQFTRARQQRTNVLSELRGFFSSLRSLLRRPQTSYTGKNQNQTGASLLKALVFIKQKEKRSGSAPLTSARASQRAFFPQNTAPVTCPRQCPSPPALVVPWSPAPVPLADRNNPRGARCEHHNTQTRSSLQTGSQHRSEGESQKGTKSDLTLQRLHRDRKRGFNAVTQPQRLMCSEHAGTRAWFFRFF